MQMSRIRIISRESPLAMWQARHVRDQLQTHYPALAIEIIGIRTEADKFLNLSLDQMGGKGAGRSNVTSFMECTARMRAMS